MIDEQLQLINEFSLLCDLSDEFQYANKWPLADLHERLALKVARELADKYPVDGVKRGDRNEIRKG